MAGFREFVTGEVLTAANVDDFLAKQAVMKFADAAARDSALGTAVVSPNALREGMVAYLDDDDEVQFYDGSVWGPVGTEPPAGIGSNVVSTVKTNVFTTSSTSFTNVTGMSATITPTSASSKVLVIVSVHASVQVGTNAAMLFRMTGGNSSSTYGDADGSRTPGHAGSRQGATSLGVGAMDGFPIVYLDDPNTTSPTTYQLEVRSGALAVHVNRTSGDANDFRDARTSSSITLIEVAV
jgi:hypothetical protein